MTATEFPTKDYDATEAFVVFCDEPVAMTTVQILTELISDSIFPFVFSPKLEEEYRKKGEESFLNSFQNNRFEAETPYPVSFVATNRIIYHGVLIFGCEHDFVATLAFVQPVADTLIGEITLMRHGRIIGKGRICTPP
ncbi:hypothetical protein [Zavarzinella formosa]|uniref:hypothetical protein n=1 Tax=Zavarzinella formosa TaxID=360055 RepID=UPI0012FBD33B|nr:hypothetical protein [Zavarzinella formosa]